MLARHLTARDFVQQPWRNGRGTTVELAREDDKRGEQLWRLSIADVKENGPFSRFRGVDRIIMLLDGQGFDIDFGPHGRAAVTSPLAPVAFSGDWPTLAENLRGPSKDLNLMTTRGMASAVVSVQSSAAPAPIADRTLFFAAGAVTIAYGTSATQLAAGELLGISEARGASAHGEGPGRFVRIDITLM